MEDMFKPALSIGDWRIRSQFLSSNDSVLLLPSLDYVAFLRQAAGRGRACKTRSNTVVNVLGMHTSAKVAYSKAKAEGVAIFSVEL
jgi:hypothetical protein